MKTVNVTVYELTPYSIEELPSGLLDFHEFIGKKIELIPEEFRGGAEVEITVEEYHMTMKIHYSRPESDTELALREDREHSIRFMKQQDELLLLAKLKAKYEA